MARPITIPETEEEYVIEDDGSLTDKNGTRWTRNSFTTASGVGETFGPGHPNPPAIIKALRKERPDVPKPEQPAGESDLSPPQP